MLLFLAIARKPRLFLGRTFLDPPRIDEGRGWSFHRDMTPSDLELLAEAAYLKAGFSPLEAASPLYLAGTLLGWSNVVERATTRAPAMVRAGRLTLRAGLSPGAQEWHVARALSRWLLDAVQDAPTEATVDMLAACIRTPGKAFRPAVGVVGPAFADLAHAFMISESSAALRFGEVTGTPVALIAPGRPIRLRGSRPPRAKPCTIRLKDAPGRVVRLYAA